MRLNGKGKHFPTFTAQMDGLACVKISPLTNEKTIQESADSILELILQVANGDKLQKAEMLHQDNCGFTTEVIANMFLPV